MENTISEEDFPYECPACNIIWPSDYLKCPHCDGYKTLYKEEKCKNVKSVVVNYLKTLLKWASWTTK
jgi:hypothetical protein